MYGFLSNHEKKDDWGSTSFIFVGAFKVLCIGMKTLFLTLSHGAYVAIVAICLVASGISNPEHISRSG